MFPSVLWETLTDAHYLPESPHLSTVAFRYYLISFLRELPGWPSGTF